ncbi:MAG TPA: hypothetical protein VJA21_28010 [Verrucomicrobiae bacterium]
MKATNNSLRAMEELTWTGLQEMNLLFDQNHLEGTPDPRHFVVTYTFQVAAPENPDSHGIRELGSPLSDY